MSWTNIYHRVNPSHQLLTKHRKLCPNSTEMYPIKKHNCYRYFNVIIVNFARFWQCRVTPVKSFMCFMFNVLATCRSNIMNWSWRERIPFARFFYVSNTYKPHQAEIGKKWSKTLWLNFWQTCPIKQVFCLSEII